MDLVLAQDGLHKVQIQFGLGHHGLKIDSSLFFPLEHDVWGCLVQTNSEAFQLALDNFLVLKWFQHVQNNEDQAASSGNGNDLSSSSFSVFGTFNDTWQVQELDFGSLVLNTAGYSGQSLKQ